MNHPGIRRTLLALILLLAAVPAFGQAPLAPTGEGDEEATWLRYPAISPDGAWIAFTYRGDLYRVPSGGGEAVRLTAHPGHDFMPVWSPDGRSIAFAGHRFGNANVFLVPAAGGVARRLTYHSADELPYAFTPDGDKVIFGAVRLSAAPSRTFPAASQPELYEVGVDGGRPTQLLTTPAEDVAPASDGRTLFYHDRKGGENEWRKYQRSAITRNLWRVDLDTGDHRQLTDTEWESRSPVLVEGQAALYYLSEESGSFNVHRMDPDGTDGRQVTSFDGAPVRFLSAADDGTLAFGHRGAIHTLAPGAPEPERVPIRIATDPKENDERVIPVSGQIQELAVSPSGREVAFVFRGEVFATSLREGTTRRITETPSREVGVEFHPEGDAVAYASERDGRWGIYEARRVRAGEEPYFFAATLFEERPLRVNDRQNAQPRYSPDGRELAFVEDLNTLRVLDLESGEVRTLLTQEYIFSTAPNHQFEWSPDGEWILFTLAVPGIARREIGIVRADGTGEVVNLTRSGFHDTSPTWILGGRAILWRSDRDGLKALAQTGPRQADAYAMFLTEEAWRRFRLSEEELALLEEMEGSEGPDGEERDSWGPPGPFDLSGARDRQARLTIHSSSMGDALVGDDGESLYYLARFEEGLNLWTTNLRTRETRMVVELNANSASMAWDADHEKIVLLADGSVSTLDPSSGSRESVPIRAEMRVSSAAERASMFDQVWRRTRDTFYTRTFHGADWDAVRAEYERFLPHVGNNHEFAELLSEMLGELNVSHSGARYNPSSDDDDATSSLGIFYDQSTPGDGIRITEVLPGGPLARPGLGVEKGTVIEAIDGTELTADVDPTRLLNRKADQNVLLRVRDDGGTREIVVKPITLGEERQLRYERWVERNRAEVKRLSDDRLGYVHIAGMNDRAYRSTFEEVMGRHVQSEGLVVDTRFNTGGDLVADLEMFLSGTRFFDYTTDDRSSGFEPNFRWTRPSVTLANEANYSDGHCFAWVYQEMGIGPLIGMPVPGTCTFGGGQALLDGLSWGVPGRGVRDTTTGRFLENWQTEPDIRVPNDPSLVAEGRDQQLERAVEELLRIIDG